jgi:hypothetical protein
METNVTAQAVQHKVRRDKDLAFDPAMEEMYSDHPSVLEREKGRVKKKLETKIA